jgi:hypothetical protein
MWCRFGRPAARRRREKFSDHSDDAIKLVIKFGIPQCPKVPFVFIVALTAIILFAVSCQTSAALSAEHLLVHVNKVRDIAPFPFPPRVRVSALEVSINSSLIKWIAGNVPYFPKTSYFAPDDESTCGFGPPPFSDSRPRYTVFENAIAIPGATVVTPQFVFQSEDRLRLDRLIAVDGHFVVLHAICFSARFPCDYQRLLSEIVPFLLAIPPGIWRQSVFFFLPRTAKQFWSDVLLMLDRQPIEIRIHWKPVFARYVYITDRRSGRLCPVGIRVLRAVVLRKLGLMKTVPSNCTLLYREFHRTILNYNETFHAIRAKWPSETWLAGPSVSPNVASQIEYYVGMKLTVFCTGANAAGIVWMRTGTAVIEFQVINCVTAWADLARVVGLKAFEAIIIEEHWRRVSIDIPVALRLIRKAYAWLSTEV